MTDEEAEIERLQEQIAELEGTLPGRIKGAQALADEKCRCFLMRAEAAEARLAVYSSGGFADADALAATYLDISAERDALRDQIRVLRDALKSAAPVINCLDVYGRYLPVKYLMADALAQTEPRP